TEAMPLLFVVVPRFGDPRFPYDLDVQRAVVADLDAAGLGSWTGTGGNEGFLVFGYRVADEAAARDGLARAMAKHVPGRVYHVRVRDGSGCRSGFEVLEEFRIEKFTLRRADGQSFGSFEQVQALLRRLFPGVQFRCLPSGPEHFRRAEERG